MSEIKYPVHLFGRDIVEDADNRPIVRVTHQGNAQTIVDALNTAAADREKLERRFSDEEIRAWAERHDISGVPTDLRQMFEDARTL